MTISPACHFSAFFRVLFDNKNNNVGGTSDSSASSSLARSGSFLAVYLRSTLVGAVHTLSGNNQGHRAAVARIESKDITEVQPLLQCVKQKDTRSGYRGLWSGKVSGQSWNSLGKQASEVIKGLRGRQKRHGLPVFGVDIQILGELDIGSPLCSRKSITTLGVDLIKPPPQMP